MTGGCTFGKAERLCSHKLIEALFAGGNKSFSAYPIRVVCMPVVEGVDVENGGKCQVLISVSKRHFKHAVDRNRVKRQIREAYRLNKQPFLAQLPKGQNFVLAFIWLSPEHFSTKVVGDKVVKLLTRLTENISMEQS